MNNIEENHSDNSANNHFISNNREELFGRDDGGTSYRMDLSAENEIDNQNVNLYRFNNHYTESIDNSGHITPPRRNSNSRSASLDRNDILSNLDINDYDI